MRFFRTLALFTALILGLYAPSSAKADPVIYLSSYLDDKIYKVLPDGSKTQFGPTVGGGGGMAFDSQGYLYHANYDTGSVYKIAPNGSFTTFATGLHNPYGVAFDQSDNLYVSNANGGTTITKVTQGGVKTTFATGLAQPQEIVFDSNGYLYTENPFVGTVSKISPAGVVSNFITGLSAPHSMSIDSSGNFYVAQYLNNQTSLPSIVKYDSNGSFLSVFAGPLDPNGTYFQTWGLDGNMYVTTYPQSNVSTGGKIWKITPAGVATVFVSGLNTPTGLAIPVPEPASLCMIGSVAIVLLSRRRNHK